MSIRVYNSLTKRKEDFIPIRDRNVGMYLCGLTVYDQSHIGHARTFIAFDAIVRYLKYKGYEVTYVRNFTDVDDKIIKRAQEEGVEASVISERYIKECREEMNRLRLLSPTYEPKVTEHIDIIIAFVQKLIERGSAYVADGSVYFEVSTFQEYGKLSKRHPEEMQSGARVEVEEKKRNPLDFVLWKASKPGEPKWASPWGYGRPGWHIECSAMAMKYLGETFDIHAGGNDLIFPHHENELAQSEALLRKPWVKYWLYTGMVQVNHEKMSKSLGNYISTKQALEKYHPEVIRFFVLNYHYSSHVDFADAFVEEKARSLEKIYVTLKNIDSLLKGRQPDKTKRESSLSEEGQHFFARFDELRRQFFEALDDDFNTAKAIGFLFDLVTVTNKYLADPEQTGGGKPPEADRLLSEVREFFSEAGEILGVFQEEPATFLESLRERKLQDKEISVQEIEKLIEERNQARKERDWKRADEIRLQLAKHHITLQDTPKGTTWSIEK